MESKKVKVEYVRNILNIFVFGLKDDDYVIIKRDGSMETEDGEILYGPANNDIDIAQNEQFWSKGE